MKLSRVALSGRRAMRLFLAAALAAATTACGGYRWADVVVRDPSRVSVRVEHDGRVDDVDRGPVSVKVPKSGEQARASEVRRNEDGTARIGDHALITRWQVDGAAPEYRMVVPSDLAGTDVIDERASVVRWTACASFYPTKRHGEGLSLEGSCGSSGYVRLTSATPLSNVVSVDESPVDIGGYGWLIPFFGIAGLSCVGSGAAFAATDHPVLAGASFGFALVSAVVVVYALVTPAPSTRRVWPRGER